MVWDVATVVNPWIMLRPVCTPLSAQIHGSILMGGWAESNVFIQKLSHWILNRDCLEALINMNYQTLIYRYIFTYIYTYILNYIYTYISNYIYTCISNFIYIYQCLVENGLPSHYMLPFKLYISNSTSLAKKNQILLLDRYTHIPKTRQFIQFFFCY